MPPVLPDGRPYTSSSTTTPSRFSRPARADAHLARARPRATCRSRWRGIPITRPPATSRGFWSSAARSPLRADGRPRDGEGHVTREVVRVVTPGWCSTSRVLVRSAPQLPRRGGDGRAAVGVVTLELSTGELRGCQLDDAASALTELVRLDPASCSRARLCAAGDGRAARASRLRDQNPRGRDRRRAQKGPGRRRERARGEAVRPRGCLPLRQRRLAYDRAHAAGRALGPLRLERYSPPISSRSTKPRSATSSWSRRSRASGAARCSGCSRDRTSMGARARRRRLLARGPRCPRFAADTMRRGLLHGPRAAHVRAGAAGAGE